MKRKFVCLFVCLLVSRSKEHLLFKTKNLNFRLSFHIELRFDDGQRYSFGMKRKEHTSEVKKIVFDKNLKMSVFMWKIGSVGEYGQLPSESKDIVYKSEMIDNNQHLASY